MKDKMSATEKTIEYLKRRIRSDDSKIGDKIGTEHEICKDLSVGRGTVREAFRTLEAQGYLELKRGCGAFISHKELNESDAVKSWLFKNKVNINEYVEVRGILEPAMASLAAVRASDAQLQQLSSIQNEFVAHASPNEYELLAHLDEHFHEEIAYMSGNKILEMVEERLNDGIITFRLQTFKIKHNIENCIKAHESILNALDSRDGTVAKIFMERHIHLITEDIEKAIY